MFILIALVQQTFKTLTAVLKDKRFWAIIIGLIGATLIAHIWLQNTDTIKGIVLPNAEKVIIVGDLHPEKVADFQTQGDNATFFKLNYQILLVGKTTLTTTMLGITTNGLTYSYEKGMDISLFQSIESQHQYQEEQLKVVMERNWFLSILVSVVTVLIAFLVIEAILE